MAELIKNPSVLRHGYRYKVRPRSRYWSSSSRYCYFLPVDYADNSRLGDGWIIDKSGQVHPGYNNSPIPLCAEALTDGQPYQDSY